MIRCIALVMMLGASLALVVGSHTAAQRTSKPPCLSYQQCNEMGTKALRAGKIDKAIKLFELQAGYAELADIEQGHVNMGPGKTPVYSLGIEAYNNLALAHIQKRDYLVARLWCRVTLRWDKENKAALRNLAQIEGKLKEWRWPKSVSGMYLQYAGRGKWSSVCVNQESSNRISVSFFGMRMGNDPEGTPASYGDFEAKLKLTNRSATYSGDLDFPSCKVQFDFAEDKVVLTQEGDCGFGYGVESTGSYDRASISKCPK